MKTSKIAAAALVLVMTGAGVAPAWSQMASPNQPEAIQAELVPTRTEAQDTLTRVGRRIHAVELSSFYSPTAEEEYLEGRREFARGNYDRAVASLNAADRELQGVPNWLGVN
jgi:hypothetical protein